MVFESNQYLGFSSEVFRIIEFAAVADKPKFSYVTARKVKDPELASVLLSVHLWTVLLATVCV